MIVKVRIKNPPSNATKWYTGWSSRGAIDVLTHFAPVAGYRFIGIGEEFQYEIPDEYAYGYLYITCQDINGIDTPPGNIPPPEIAPDRDAWRVYTTMSKGEYTFDWRTGALTERAGLGWLITLVAVIAFATSKRGRRGNV